jgi:hypothetical protein
VTSWRSVSHDLSFARGQDDLWGVNHMVCSLILRAKIAAARRAMEHDNQRETDAALRAIHFSLLELPSAIAA